MLEIKGRASQDHGSIAESSTRANALTGADIILTLVIGVLDLARNSYHITPKITAGRSLPLIQVVIGLPTSTTVNAPSPTQGNQIGRLLVLCWAPGNRKCIEEVDNVKRQIWYRLVPVEQG
eukprot:3240951-Rhodomonas_salina.3